MKEVDEDDLPSESDFRPTAAMRRYAEACATGKELSEKESIKPATVRRWKYREEFRDWFRREVAELREGEAANLWNVVLGLAKAGNLRALKLYLDRFDRKKSGKKVEMPETFLDVALLAKKARENPEEMYWPEDEGLDEAESAVTDYSGAGYNGTAPRKPASNDDASMQNGAQPCTTAAEPCSAVKVCPEPVRAADDGAKMERQEGEPIIEEPKLFVAPVPPATPVTWKDMEALGHEYLGKVNPAGAPLFIARAFAAHLTRHSWPELQAAVRRSPRGRKPDQLMFET